MPVVSVSAPYAAIRWVAAVSSATFVADAQLPMAVAVQAGGSVVVIDNAGTSMTIGTVGTYYVAPQRLGAVVGSVFLLYGG